MPIAIAVIIVHSQDIVIIVKRRHFWMKLKANRGRVYALLDKKLKSLGRALLMAPADSFIEKLRKPRLWNNTYSSIQDFHFPLR
jgi:hypothetical protein